jgi:hypothetical protein
MKLGGLEEAAHGLHHPARHDDHVQARVARIVQRLQGARPQRSVLPDERAVEVRRDDVDVPREIRREDQAVSRGFDQPFGLPPVAFTT